MNYEALRITDDLPTHPTFGLIRERLEGERKARERYGTTLEHSDYRVWLRNGTPTPAARSEQLLTLKDPNTAETLRDVLVNTQRLRYLLEASGEEEEIERPGFLLSRDQENKEYFMFLVNNHEFDLTFTHYYGNFFDMEIEFQKPSPDSRRPLYRSGRLPIKDSMTQEEGEIFNYYAGIFMQRQVQLQLPPWASESSPK